MTAMTLTQGVVTEQEVTDEFGYAELGRAFYEEFTQLSNNGSFKGFICGCSPVEILVHLINERDELQAQRPSPDSKLDAYRKALASAVNELDAIAVFAEDNGRSAVDKSDGQAWAAHARAIREVRKALAAGGA